MGAENPKALGRASRQGPVCRAVALRGARACCSLPEHPQTPRQPELRKTTDSPVLEEAAALAKARDSENRCEALWPKMGKVVSYSKGSFPEYPAAGGLGPIPA